MVRNGFKQISITFFFSEKRQTPTPTIATTTVSQNSFFFTLDTNVIVMIIFVSAMTAFVLAYLLHVAAKKCKKWKQDYDVRRGPKVEENEDYDEDDEGDGGQVEHENVYYGEVRNQSKLSNF